MICAISIACSCVAIVVSVAVTINLWRREARKGEK